MTADTPLANVDLADIDTPALLTEVHRLTARIAELEAGIAWRDAERARWADVHATVERAIDKGWSSIDTCDLEGALGPEVAAVDKTGHTS
jgi:hypothetical protein